MKKFLLTLIAVTCVVFSAPAFALSCAPYSEQAAQAELDSYDIVALGRVVSDTDIGADARQAVMYVQPIQFIKGRASQPIVKITYNADQETFGFVRAKGTEVYITRSIDGEGGFSVTGPCSHIVEYLRAQEVAE